MFGVGAIRRQVIEGFERAIEDHATCITIMIFSRQIAAKTAVHRHFSASPAGIAIAPSVWQGQQRSNTIMGNNINQNKDQQKQSPGQVGSGNKQADQQNQQNPQKQDQSGRSGNQSNQTDKQSPQRSGGSNH
jgi:hypothetical protein